AMDLEIGEHVFQFFGPSQYRATPEQTIALPLAPAKYAEDLDAVARVLLDGAQEQLAHRIDADNEHAFLRRFMTWRNVTRAIPSGVPHAHSDTDADECDEHQQSLQDRQGACDVLHAIENERQCH